jgi:hypothetical protein
MDDPEGSEERAVWYPYAGGSTINTVGGAGGYVLRDEELGDPDDPEEADARLTLEQGRIDAPGFILTATLYGWLFHSVRYPDESEATAAYDAMRAELTAMSELIPYEEDGPKHITEKADKLGAAIAAFESRFAVPA